MTERPSGPGRACFGFSGRQREIPSRRGLGLQGRKLLTKKRKSFFQDDVFLVTFGTGLSARNGAAGKIDNDVGTYTLLLDRLQIRGGVVADCDVQRSSGREIDELLNAGFSVGGYADELAALVAKNSRSKNLGGPGRRAVRQNMDLALLGNAGVSLPLLRFRPPAGKTRDRASREQLVSGLDGLFW